MDLLTVLVLGSYGWTTGLAAWLHRKLEKLQANHLAHKWAELRSERAELQGELEELGSSINELRGLLGLPPKSPGPRPGSGNPDSE